MNCEKFESQLRVGFTSPCPSNVINLFLKLVFKTESLEHAEGLIYSNCEHCYVPANN